MADLELQHRVRIALSWRAEARRLDAEARARFESGELEAGRFRHLQQKLTTEFTTAQRALDGLRQHEAETAARLGAHLRDCLARKASIAEQVKAGGIAHETATAEIARLDEEINAMRDAVGEFNRLLSTEDPVALGGKIDLPLTEYPVRLAGAGLMLGGGSPVEAFQRFHLTRRQTIMAVAGALFVLAGMAMLWFIAAQNRNIEMVARWSEQAPKEVAVECANHGSSDFLIYVPAPEDGAAMQRGAFSVRVEDTPPSGDPVSLLTFGAWTNEGRATQYSNPQRILAGKHVTFVLMLDRVKGLVSGPHRIEVQCVNPGGRVVNRKSVEISLTATAPT